MILPAGCAIHDLTTQSDSRGTLTEIFRAEWGTGIEPVQWNFVRSEANVLRGVHVHVVHNDYIVVVAGKMELCLVDIRPESSTHGVSTIVTLEGARMQAAFVATGVAHGFYFPEPSSICYSVSHYWNTVDEIGCRWDDPALGLPWQMSAPLLSKRDREAGSAQHMTEQYLDTRREINAGHG